jgi:NAD(P)H-flavin reductase
MSYPSSVLWAGGTRSILARRTCFLSPGLGVAAVIALADEAIAAGKSVTLLQGARSSDRLYHRSCCRRS